MRRIVLICGLGAYVCGFGYLGYMSLMGKGVSVPKIQKKKLSIRSGSVGHRRYAGGFRHGK